MPEPRAFDGEQLAAILAERGWTQRELARRSGHDEVQISKYVNGRVPPSARSWVRLADALGVPMDALRAPRPREEVPA